MSSRAVLLLLVVLLLVLMLVLTGGDRTELAVSDCRFLFFRSLLLASSLTWNTFSDVHLFAFANELFPPVSRSHQPLFDAMPCVQMLGENSQECPQWLASMAMYGGGGGGGGGRRTRGGSKGGRNFGARDFRKDGGGGGGAWIMWSWLTVGGKVDRPCEGRLLAA